VPARNEVTSGELKVVPKAGSNSTRASCANCHLHLEIMTPNPPMGADQARGNNRIRFRGRPEV